MKSGKLTVVSEGPLTPPDWWALPPESFMGPWEWAGKEGAKEAKKELPPPIQS